MDKPAIENIYKTFSTKYGIWIPSRMPDTCLYWTEISSGEKLHRVRESNLPWWDYIYYG